MSNYGHDDYEDEGGRDDPRDTSAPPDAPVKDVFGQHAQFGDEDPFDVLNEYKAEVQEKFKNIWKKTFKQSANISK